MTKTVIIDGVSSEFNRGSFCYSPYILYAALQERDNVEVELYENFSAADIDDLPQDADNYYIGLWSYPQIDHVKVLLRFLPLQARKMVFGYDPLIEANKFPLLTIRDSEILDGIRNYVKYYDDFEYLLLSDCDMHLKDYEGTVYPMFTSYGCPNGCSFCPATVQQNNRLALTVDETNKNLSLLKDQGKTNIHFTDEDFLFDIDRAHAIVNKMKSLGGFQAIALASRHKLSRYIERYGTEELKAAGFKLFEVGLEAADQAMANSMGKGKTSMCEELANTCDIPILWLTITFFPGETIKTLNATGQYLSQHGFDYGELKSRIVTNGTRGGLGQFFQYYHGTNQSKNLAEEGMFVDQRPLRLLPSFIPYSFLNSRITSVHTDKIEDKWYDLYRVAPLEKELKRGRTIQEVMSKRTMLEDDIDACVSLAISARLGVIE